MERIEILYDHYKESCELARKNEVTRNKLFIVLCILLGLLFLFSYDSNSILGLIQSWIRGSYNCDLMFSSNIIQAILWIVLFIVTLRYLGLNINLDRSYSYIHKLENEINEEGTKITVTREGKSYLNNYPILNNITYYSYRVILPIIYYCTVILKLKLEYYAQWSINIPIIFQITLGILCNILIVTYLIENIIDIVNDIIERIAMKYKYTKKDIDLISWEKMDSFIDKIYKDINNYLKSNNLSIKYIVPIMRGGGVPAIKFSHMFNVIDMLPIQLKHNHETHGIDTKIGLEYVKDITVNEDECILLVEGNHVTGETANIAVQMIREKFGKDVKIIYVSLTRDYTYKDSVKDICFTSWAMTTNETKELSKEKCNELNINYNLVSVYPWENIEEELDELNNS